VNRQRLRFSKINKRLHVQLLSLNVFFVLSCWHPETQRTRKIHLFTVNPSDIDYKMNQSLSLSEYLRSRHKNTSNRWQKRWLYITRKATPHCRRTQPQQPQERGLVPARRQQQQQQKVF
jgi:hypothetical protein